MYSGSWGILITLSGANDLPQCRAVWRSASLLSADPIRAQPDAEALPNATYAIDQDPRFQAKTHGRIVNGVLTTEPVNVRFHKVTNSIYLERTLNDARLQLTLNPDGGLDGYLAGYTPVEDMYNFQYGFRDGKKCQGRAGKSQTHRGNLAMGQAAVLGHSCNGAYYALHELADGGRDPTTGKCTSISTQYRIKAIPAFVVELWKRKSLNEDLKGQMSIMASVSQTKGPTIRRTTAVLALLCSCLTLVQPAAWGEHRPSVANSGRLPGAVRPSCAG